MENTMRKLKVIITYKDQTYTQVFILREDELVEDVIEEIQEEWCEEYKDEILDFESEKYNINYQLV